MQEDGIEVTVKLFQFVSCQGRGIRHLLDFFYHARFDFPVDILPVFVQFADIAGTDVEYVTYIFFLDIIGFRQFVVGIQ